MDEFHPFRTQDLVHVLPKELFLFSTQGIRFVSGPSFDDFQTTNGKLHQRKNYKVCVQVSPEYFSDEWLSSFIVAKQAKNDGMDTEDVSSYHWILTLFLGTTSGIEESLQQYIRDSSKTWYNMVKPDTKPNLYFFDVTFTKVTSRRNNNNHPFRLYAQLFLESPESRSLVAEGRSMLFDIFSHSKQYSYPNGKQCLFCGSSSSVSSIPDSDLFNRVQKVRKIQQQTCSAIADNMEECKKKDEVLLPTPLSLMLSKPIIHMIHPKSICLNQSFVVFFDCCSPLNANNDRLFSFWDGCQNLIELRRVQTYENAFIGVLPLDCNYTKTKVMLTAVGEDPARLIECCYKQPHCCELFLVFDTP